MASLLEELPTRDVGERSRDYREAPDYRRRREAPPRGGRRLRASDPEGQGGGCGITQVPAHAGCPPGTGSPSEAPPLGMVGGYHQQEEGRNARGLFPLPRFCWPVRKCRGGHSLGRARKECARAVQANRILGRLEQLDRGRLWEEVDAAPASAPSHCGRSAREGAAAQVWEAVCSRIRPWMGAKEWTRLQRLLRM